MTALAQSSKLARGSTDALTGHMQTPQGGDDGQSLPVPAALTQQQIEEIADDLIRERYKSPPPSPAREIASRTRELSPADEVRIEDALARRGAIAPGHTLRAERAAAHDEALRIDSDSAERQ